jgi:hypothetical protein
MVIFTIVFCMFTRPGIICEALERSEDHLGEFPVSYQWPGVGDHFQRSILSLEPIPKGAPDAVPWRTWRTEVD